MRRSTTSAGPACTSGATSGIAPWLASERMVSMAGRDGRPQVGIVMGSDTDWETMEGAAERLQAFEIDFEAHVMSAHRSPKAVMQYAQTARRRGLMVLI